MAIPKRIQALLYWKKFKTSLKPIEGVIYQYGYDGDSCAVAFTDTNIITRIFVPSIYKISVAGEAVSKALSKYSPCSPTLIDNITYMALNFIVDDNNAISLCERSYGGQKPDGSMPSVRDDIQSAPFGILLWIELVDSIGSEIEKGIVVEALSVCDGPANTVYYLSEKD